MKPMFLFALLCTVATPLSAKPVVGEPAPAFSAIDSHGKTHALADYAGKTVVLEWSNPECPFVRKHYGAGNLQKQQGDATAHGVVWLTVNSGAPGKQGHFDAAGANAWIAKVGSKASAYLIDGDALVIEAARSEYFTQAPPQIDLVVTTTEGVATSGWHVRVPYAAAGTAHAN